jgi:F-type H+-transporting ATPase subunit delta
MAEETVLDAGVVRSRTARVYAESLLGLAAKQNQADAVGDELVALHNEVLRKNPAVAAYLANPTISKRQKGPILASAFASASPLVKNLLGVLNENGRLNLLPQVIASYRELLDKRAGRVRVVVKSAVPLRAEQLDTLKTQLTKSLGQTPVIASVVDPELIGGLIVQIGDRVVDTSVRTRLQTLRAQLMDRGSSYVLQN